ncbi:TVP38/TMEM64 family protein [Amycolatopsis lurida]
MTGRTKLVVALVLLAALVTASLVIDIPAPAQLRAWATGAGWIAPVLLLGAYSVLTVAPIPRTSFNVVSGLLLGNVLGIGVALLATVISAALGFGLARLLGREWVAGHLERGRIRALDARLAGGGVLAVASLRLIPFVPFAPMSWACGVLSVRFGPYLAGTAIGSLPGTVLVVLLGDALTGTTHPALLAGFAGFALIGAAGLHRVIRRTNPESVAPDAAVS